MKRYLLLGIFLFQPISTQAVWQGYVEGEFLYLSVPIAGRLQQLAVQRGQVVQAGDSLFSLENQPETFAVQDAQLKVYNAQSKLQDLQKGQRPSELEILKAKRNQTQIDLSLSEKEAARVETLFKKNLIQKETVDNARATIQRNKAKLAETEAQLQTAQLGGREDIVKTAENDLQIAQLALQKAQWTLDQKSLFSPQSGLVHETYYREGEWLNAGAPVLALLPPSAIKIRFYVSESVLGALQIGQLVHIHCDSCSDHLTANISFISTQAEYTPPVLYNLENRAKLVWRIEARPSSVEIAQRLHVGQPVDVFQ
ncbi:MAG: hypothetical protein RIT27_322 [Pseudomonadota bacterium]|jgi:HlyD family secretion protein